MDSRRSHDHKALREQHGDPTPVHRDAVALQRMRQELRGESSTDMTLDEIAAATRILDPERKYTSHTLRSDLALVRAALDRQSQPRAIGV
jgi:hypothetical protein